MLNFDAWKKGLPRNRYVSRSSREQYVFFLASIQSIKELSFPDRKGGYDGGFISNRNPSDPLFFVSYIYELYIYTMVVPNAMTNMREANPTTITAIIHSLTPPVTTRSVSPWKIT